MVAQVQAPVVQQTPITANSVHPPTTQQPSTPRTRSSAQEASDDDHDNEACAKVVMEITIGVVLGIFITVVAEKNTGVICGPHAATTSPQGKESPKENADLGKQLEEQEELKKVAKALKLNENANADAITKAIAKMDTQSSKNAPAILETDKEELKRQIEEDFQQQIEVLKEQLKQQNTASTTFESEKDELNRKIEELKEQLKQQNNDASTTLVTAKEDLKRQIEEDFKQQIAQLKNQDKTLELQQQIEQQKVTFNEQLDQLKKENENAAKLQKELQEQLEKDKNAPTILETVTESNPNPEISEFSPQPQKKKNTASISHKSQKSIPEVKLKQEFEPSSKSRDVTVKKEPFSLLAFQKAKLQEKEQQNASRIPEAQKPPPNNVNAMQELDQNPVPPVTGIPNPKDVKQFAAFPDEPEKNASIIPEAPKSILGKASLKKKPKELQKTNKKSRYDQGQVWK